MNSLRETLLCEYRYDGLDRLIGHARPDRPMLQRFYCKSRLATEIEGAVQHSIIQHGDLLLAQQQRQGDEIDITLLATDLQRSVLQTIKAINERHPIAYSPYGHRPAETCLSSLLGFNGERSDPVTGHYLLGNGYRAFNPVLMRFNSPDSLSPFGKGGLNPYAYCTADPINNSDPTGHVWFKFIWIRNASGDLSIGFELRRGRRPSFSAPTSSTPSSATANSFPDNSPAWTTSQDAVEVQSDRSSLNSTRNYASSRPTARPGTALLNPNEPGAQLRTDRETISSSQRGNASNNGNRASGGNSATNHSTVSAPASSSSASRYTLFDPPPAYEPPPSYSAATRAGKDRSLPNIRRLIHAVRRRGNNIRRS